MKHIFTLLHHFRSTFLLLLFSVGMATSAFAEVRPGKNPEQDKLSVYIFLAETCPICQFYTHTLRELWEEFGSDQLVFKGVFPNTESTEPSVAEFKKKYAVPFALIVDPDQKLTKELQATITPEVIVKNERTGEVLYRGRIDDSYYRVGKKRPAAREHDLKNALSELKKNQSVSKPKTEAVGCYITFLP